MKMHRGGIMILVMALLLSGCQRKPTEVVDREPTATYDWMAGESPVPNKRICMKRSGLSGVDHAVSPTGIYIVPQVYEQHEGYKGLAEGFYILYADHGSNTFRKLCGRADCTHDNKDCNAWLYRGNKVTYYQGKLYAVTGWGPYQEECKLIRMEPDGSQHKEVLDFQEFSKEKGTDYALVQLIADGYCEFSLYVWKEEGDGTRTGEWKESYLYKLDGSWKEPRLLDAGCNPTYQCGDMMVAMSGGPEEYGYWSMDLETGTATRLIDLTEVPVWVTEQEVHFLRNGVLLSRDYATNQEKILLDTGLRGDYSASYFPDCFVIASQEMGDEADNNLYIYNWAYELVDTVKLDFPYEFNVVTTIMAETAERIILTNGVTLDCVPLYYIEKSELGTGNVQLYAYQYE